MKVGSILKDLLAGIGTVTLIAVTIHYAEAILVR